MPAPVSWGPGSTRKGDKGTVVHLDYVSGCRGIYHKLVFTGDDIIGFDLGIPPLYLNNLAEFFECFSV